jgi:hypothetical protein
MLYLKVLFYFGSLLLLSYHYSQLIQDIYRTGLVLSLLRLWVRIRSGAWVSVLNVVCCQVEVSATK